jgi:hypothetical protein
MLDRVALASFVALTACTSTADPSEPVAAQTLADTEGASAATNDVLLYECKPEAGAPYAAIRVFRHDPYAADEPGAKPEADEDGEQTVMIEFNDGAQGTNGTCVMQPGKNYACNNGDRSFRMTWLGTGAQGRGEQVKVEEDWLFGSKTFSAACVRKG